MIQQDNHKLTEQLRRNMQFSEDRIDLLDTIRDMIDFELDRRGVKPESNPHPKNSPTEPTVRDPARRSSFWQRIVGLFTTCL